MPVEAQKELRKGINKGRQVFRKGRSEKIAFRKANHQLPSIQ
jgi:UPF0176 protein